MGALPLLCTRSVALPSPCSGGVWTRDSSADTATSPTTGSTVAPALRISEMSELFVPSHDCIATVWLAIAPKVSGCAGMKPVGSGADCADLTVCPLTGFDKLRVAEAVTIATQNGGNRILFTFFSTSTHLQSRTPNMKQLGVSDTYL